MESASPLAALGAFSLSHSIVSIPDSDARNRLVAIMVTFRNVDMGGLVVVV